MPWARVDDGWWCHPKVMGLSLSAAGLWIRALSWSCAQRSDRVPETLLPMVGGSNSEAKELVDAGLWEPGEGGWLIHDWHDYQGLSLSEKRAEAGRKGGLKSRPPGSKREANPDASRSKPQASAEAGTQPVPSQPNPTPQPPLPEPSKQTAVVVADASPAKPAREPDGWERWWELYPRKTGKQKAKAKYAAALKRTSAGCLRRSLERHADAWRRFDYGEFVPHPATWLEQGRWDDDTPGPRSNGRAPSRADDNQQKIARSLARMEGR